MMIIALREDSGGGARILTVPLFLLLLLERIATFVVVFWLITLRALMVEEGIAVR